MKEVDATIHLNSQKDLCAMEIFYMKENELVNFHFSTKLCFLGRNYIFKATKNYIC